jgi:hypothetical protein
LYYHRSLQISIIKIAVVANSKLAVVNYCFRRGYWSLEWGESAQRLNYTQTNQHSNVIALCMHCLLIHSTTKASQSAKQTVDVSIGFHYFCGCVAESEILCKELVFANLRARASNEAVSVRLFSSSVNTQNQFYKLFSAEVSTKILL